MLKILIGKSKTGKSKYIMDEMDKDINQNKEVTIFVPSQMRMVTEEKYMEYQKKSGIMNINFTTISSYISDYLERKNIVNEENYLSNIDKKILVSKLITENEDIFKLFKKSKDYAGFADSIKIYIDLFKKGEITKENIDNIDEKKYLLLSQKMKEIYSIYEKYKEEAEKKFIDSIDEVDIYINNFSIQNNAVDNFSFYFDSYNNFTNAELKFIAFLLKKGFDITIAVSSNLTDLVEETDKFEDINYLSCKADDEDSIFSDYNLTVINLIKLAKKENIKYEVIPFLTRKNEQLIKNDIITITDSIFTENFNNKTKIESDNINIYFANNIFEELEAVCRDICKKVKNGARYIDFLIYTSDIEEYKNIAKNVFKNYNLPVSIDISENISLSVIYKYISYLFEMSKYTLSLTNLMKILKLNLLDVSVEDVAYLENYLLEYGIKEEYKLRNKFNDKKSEGYDIDRLQNIKEKTIDVLLDLKYKITKLKSAAGIKDTIYNHLDNNNILDRLSKEAEKLEKNNDSYIRYLSSLNYLSFNKVCSLFESIAKIYDSSIITVDQFYEIFKSVAVDIKVRTVPKSKYEIEFVDINVSKVLPKKYVYFLGVNEGKIPRISSQDSFFTDKEIDTLKNNANIVIKEDTFSKNLLAKYNVYEAFNLATNEINLYYLGSDSKGKSLRKSELINDILEISNIKVQSVNKEDFTIFSKKDMLLYINKKIREETLDIDTIAMYNYLKKDSKYNQVMSYIRKSDNLSKDTLDNIYINSEISSSISRLEHFKRCPFSYFVKYILKVDERKVYEITSIDLGSFMHSVLEQFSKYLFERKIMWNEILDENSYFDILNEIIDKTLEDNLYKHKENIKYDILKRKLYSTMKKAVTIIAKSFSQSQFKPFAYELEFTNGSKYLPIEIRLDESKVMLLRGKIDRVDTAIIDDNIYARIVDYKSSDKDLDIDDVKEGISLQLITYLSAFISSSNQNIKPAGVMYFNLSDKLTKLNSFESDENKITESIIEKLRMKGIFLKDLKILTAMDKKLDSKERLINVSMKTVSSNSKSKSLLESREFDDICSEIKVILKDIGKEIIIDGKTSIEPNKKVDACKYCKYMHICRKNNMC